MIGVHPLPLPSVSILNLNLPRVTMQSFTNTNINTRGGNVNIRLHNNTDADSQRQNLIEWLSPINFFTRHQDIISRRQEGTGEWLLYSDEFKRWEANSGSVLWCSGAPGVGKTMLASIAAEYLRNKQDLEVDIGVAIMYCNYMERDVQSPINLMASLWRQLVLHRSISSAVDMLHNRHHEPRTRPSLKEILEVLKSVVHKLSKVFIVVDGLDECPEDDDVRQKLLTSLQEIQPTVHLMFTSRPHVTVASDFPASVTLEIRANDEDMKNYIDARMKGRSLAKVLKGQIELQNEIRTKIVEISDGMFLLAQLHMDALSTKYNRKDVRDALSTLPKSLDSVYDQAMTRIDGQNHDHKKLGQRVLIWLSYAFAPFSVRMLQEAVSVNLGDANLDDESLPNEEIMLSVCAGLVVVHKQDNTVRLVHFTTQKYLERVRETYFPDPASYVPTTCITYLSFDKFKSCRPIPPELFLPSSPPSSFLDYALQYWAIHAHGTPEQKIATLIRTFITACLDSFKTWTTFKVPSRCTPMWVAASFNLEGIVHQLLEEGEDTNWREEGDLLVVASKHEGLVRLLLDWGASIDAVGEHRRTALYTYAASGHYDIAHLLLSMGVASDVDAQGEKYGTALQVASFYGHGHIVNMLLEKGANVNLVVQGGMFASPLHAACFSGEQSIVGLLLERGADIHPIGVGLFATPLQAACAGPNKPRDAVINLLIEEGVDVNTRGGKYGTALQAASHSGDQRLVHLLLQKGADVNAQCGEYGTALQAAISVRSVNPFTFQMKAVVKLLLEYGADVNVREGKYGHALMAALRPPDADDIERDYLMRMVDNQIVRQLFVHGADFGDLELEHKLGYEDITRVAWITTHEDVIRTLFETLEENYSSDLESITKCCTIVRKFNNDSDLELHFRPDMSRLDQWNCDGLKSDALEMTNVQQDELGTRTELQEFCDDDVVADMSMHNEDPSRPTNLVMNTLGKMCLVLDLLSEQASERSGAEFNVIVSAAGLGGSRLGYLAVQFSTAPVHSLQHIDAQCAYGDVLLKLSPAYEGSFWLESQAEKIIAHSGAEDPSGKGRKRSSKICKVGSNILLGIVYWEPFDIDKPMGWVNAQSTHGSVKVII